MKWQREEWLPEVLQGSIFRKELWFGFMSNVSIVIKEIKRKWRMNETKWINEKKEENGEKKHIIRYKLIAIFSVNTSPFSSCRTGTTPIINVKLKNNTCY